MRFTAWIQSAGLVAAGLVLAGGVYRDQPPPGHTGGFGEPTCHRCHFDGVLNDPEGQVRLLGLPEQVTPGQVYPLVVALSRPGMQRGGFQLSARFADGGAKGRQAGTWTIAEEAVAVDIENQVQYIRHTLAGTSPQAPDSVRWTFEWRAPDSVFAPIVFHLAANAANGDDSEFGDTIYTLEVVSGHDL